MLQDAPTGDVAPAYLATLPTTPAVLAALRSARSARLALERGQKPVGYEVVDLTTLSACAPAYRRLERVDCSAAAFSPDGQYLAVQFATGGSVLSRTPGTGVRQYDWVKGVAVLKATEGYEEQACVYRVSGPPAVCWAPDTAPHLSIALKDRHKDLSASDQERQPVILHALGPQTECIFRHACARGPDLGTELSWSRSGRLLLVRSTAFLEDDGEADGGLWVFDVVEDAVVAQSDFAAEPRPWRCTLEPVVFHPSSEGLVFSHWVKLFNPEAFAGKLSLAFLPEPCFLASPDTGDAFSPDGKLLAVRMLGPEEPPPIHDTRMHAQCIMHCDLEGLQPTFRQAGTSFLGRGWSWLPCSSGVVVGTFLKYKHTQQSHIVRLGQQLQSVAIPGNTLRLPLVFSPSWQMAAENARAQDPHGFPRIISLQSGRVCWAADVRGMLVSFLPSGCGIVCAGSGRARTGKVNNLHIFTFA